MTMVKLFSAGDWSQLPVEQNQIKIASVGLSGADKQSAEKFASPEVLHWLSKISTHPDCFYVHKLAMGGSHRYGPNRWGDGFREEILKRDCPTFEQKAKAYRRHKSNGPYYGQVKLARLREPMGVVELVTEYYGTDDIAKQRGGRLADQEIQEFKTAGFIPVSMGSLVPGDVCSVCSHFAKTTKDRCMSKKEGGMCTLFGCKNGMLKVAEDGRMNYVDNPQNTFYDISKVPVGADPVANGLLLPIGDFAHQMMQASKLASFDCDNLDLDTLTLNSQQRDAMQLAYFWASEEQKLATLPDDDLAAGFASAGDANVKLAGLFSADVLTKQDTLKGLIHRNYIPTFSTFAKAAGLDFLQIRYAEMFVPNLFTRLIDARQLIPTIKVAGIGRNFSKIFSNNFASDIAYGIDSRSVIQRTLRCNAQQISPTRRKSAEISSELPKVVVDYAAMKLAWFMSQERVDPHVLAGVVHRDLFQSV